MLVGTLVTPRFKNVFAYRDITSYDYAHAGSMKIGNIGLVLKRGYALSGTPFCLVAFGGTIGWIQDDELRRASSETR